MIWRKAPDSSLSHPIFARFYERMSVTMDEAGVAEHRHALVAGLSGRVIVAAEQPGLMQRMQRLADATVWPRLLAGCHTSRHTAHAIASAGFIIEELNRFRFPPTGLSDPAAPHIRGSAVRPPEDRQAPAR